MIPLSLRERQKRILNDESYLHGEWYAKDVRGCASGDIPHADLWAFGFPCQDISISGKCAGFAGERSSLFFEIIRLLGGLAEEDRPKWLIAENVKNLLSINRGFDFLRAILALEELGYSLEWRLLNSKNYGVPQNRERVFIVANLRGECAGKIFPLREPKAEDPMELPTGLGTDEQLIETRGGRIHPIDVCNTLDASYSKGLLCNAKDKTSRGRAGVAYGWNCRQSKEFTHPPLREMSRCLKSNNDAAVVLEENVCACLTPERESKRQNGRRFKNPGEPMFTLTAQDRHGVAIIEEDADADACDCRKNGD